MTEWAAINKKIDEEQYKLDSYYRATGKKNGLPVVVERLKQLKAERAAMEKKAGR